MRDYSKNDRQESHEITFVFSDLVNVLFKHQKYFTVVFSVSFLASLLFNLFQSPVYKVTQTIKIGKYVEFDSLGEKKQVSFLGNPVEVTVEIEQNAKQLINSSKIKHFSIQNTPEETREGYIKIFANSKNKEDAVVFVGKLSGLIIEKHENLFRNLENKLAAIELNIKNEVRRLKKAKLQLDANFLALKSIDGDLAPVLLLEKYKLIERIGILENRSVDLLGREDPASLFYKTESFPALVANNENSIYGEAFFILMGLIVSFGLAFGVCLFLEFIIVPVRNVSQQGFVD